MSDSVKFIFKTLIKVPVIIFFTFFVFNILAFFFIYFKVLGISYVVMQTAVENNYLPASEAQTLYAYIDRLNDIQMVENAGLIVYVDESNPSDVITATMTSATDTSAMYGDTDARRRRQYGREVTVGVQCDYVFVWPLDYRDTTEGGTGVDGVDGSGGFKGFESDAALQADRENEGLGGNTSRSNICIYYTVPGLKYYPDMLTY